MSIEPESDSANPDLDRLDSFCDRYEAVWLSGERPCLKAFLDESAPAERALLFSYLLEIELDYRMRAGETPEAADYLGDFPKFEPVIRRQIDAAGTRSQHSDVTLEVPSESNLAGQRLRTGASLGGYELLEELGRGGMGVVFRARQKALNRIVALKTIKHADSADEQLIRRFQAEAETAARLNHEGIVPVFDVGEADGLHFFSMQLVDGASLSEMVSEGPLPPRRAAEIARDVALAMQCAHEHGLVHRDLKPANVLMDQGNRPKITDFGLAKLVRGDSNLTMTGQILGTPGYMPPEQATGDSERVDALSDVYSIGATLYHLLTGTPPFRGAAPVEVLRQVTEKEPVPPRQLNPTVSVDLDTICLKALQKERNKRYGSAAELAADLDRWLSGQPIIARRIGPAGRLIRWCRRQPVVAGLIAAVAASLLIGTIVSANYAIEADIRAGEAERKEATATRLKRVADDARQAEEKQRRETEELLYWTTIQLAADRLADGNAIDVATMLWNTPRELRGWEWGWLMARCQHPRWVIDAHPGSVSRLAVTADGSKLVSIGTDDSCALWDVGSRDLLWRTSAETKFHDVAIDPAGRFIAVTVEGEIQILDVDDGSTIKKLSVNRAHLIAISPDGNTLYSCKAGLKDLKTHEVIAWNTSDWTKQASRNIAGAAGAIATDMAGKFVVVGTGNYPSMTYVYHADSLHQAEKIGSGWRVESVAFDSTRGVLARSMGNHLQLFRWEDNDAFEIDNPNVSDTIAVDVVYHRPLDCFVSSALDGTVAVHRPSGALVGELHHGDSAPRLAILGEHRLISGGRNGQIKCWDLATVLDQRRFHGFSNGKMHGASEIAMTSDGELVAYCGYSEDYEKFHIANLHSTRQAMYEQSISQKKMRFGRFVPGTSHFCFVVPGEIRFYDAAMRPWRLLRTIPCRDGRQFSLDVDAKGKRLLLAYRSGGADCFDLVSGTPLPAAEVDASGNSQIRADGQLAIMQRSSADGADVWNTETGKHIARLAIKEECKSATLHPTEPIAALGNAEGDVLIWDIEQRKELRRFSGHDSWVNQLRFSPDGERLFTASQDQTVRVWNWRMGKSYLTLKHGNTVQALDITPNGRILATTSTIPHANIREVPRWNVAVNEQEFLDGVHDLRVRDQARLLLVELSAKHSDFESLRTAIGDCTWIGTEVKDLATKLADDWKD